MAMEDLTRFSEYEIGDIIECIAKHQADEKWPVKRIKQIYGLTTKEYHTISVLAFPAMKWRSRLASVLHVATQNVETKLEELQGVS